MSIVVAQAPLPAALSTFFNTRPLGPDRAALPVNALDALDAVDAVDDDTAAEHTTHLAAIERQIADLCLRQKRLLGQSRGRRSRRPVHRRTPPALQRP